MQLYALYHMTCILFIQQTDMVFSVNGLPVKNT